MENKAERYQKAVNIVDVMDDSPLGKLLKKGLALQELNDKFNRTFPAEFRGLFRVVGLNGNSLSIDTANAIVRQGILFREQALLALIQQTHPEVVKLTVWVNPAVL